MYACMAPFVITGSSVINVDKQSSRNVLSKTRSESMQQIYRRGVALQLIEIAHQNGCSPVTLLHIFRTAFLKNTSVGLLLYIEKCVDELDREIFTAQEDQKGAQENRNTFQSFENAKFYGCFGCYVLENIGSCLYLH